MLEALAEVGSFLVEHGDLVTAIRDAIDGGASKAELLRVIRASAVATSDAVMDEELGPVTRRR